MVNEGTITETTTTTTCHTLINEARDNDEVPFVSDYNEGKEQELTSNKNKIFIKY